MNRLNLRIRTSLLLILCVPPALAAGAAADEQWQSHESIRAAAVAAINAAADAPGTRIVAEADAIDSRLRLTQCPAPLQAELPFGGVRGSRVTVEVRCAGTESWKVYIPVRLARWGQVVVAARAVARDQVLTAEDLLVTELELTGLRQGHLSDPAQLLGKKMRRGVEAGSPITVSSVLTPPVIQRGQKVTVRAAGSQLSIAMNARALDNGGPGEVINVENLSSGRTIQAIVRSAQVVEVLLD